MDQNTMTNCPQCPRRCPIEAVSCERGEELVRRIKAGEPLDLSGLRESQERRHRDRHGHGKHDGHGRPDKNTLEGLLMICGHTLHHGEKKRAELFAGLTGSEQQELKVLLAKLVNSWE